MHAPRDSAGRSELVLTEAPLASGTDPSAGPRGEPPSALPEAPRETTERPPPALEGSASANDGGQNRQKMYCYYPKLRLALAIVNTENGY